MNGLTPENKKKYLHSGLALNRFEVMDILPQKNGKAVIIMLSKDAENVAPWYVQYCGSGKYFRRCGEMMKYISDRHFIY